MPDTEPAMLDLHGLPTAPAPPKRRTRKPRKPAHTWSLTAFGATWCPVWALLGETLDRLASEGHPITRVDVDKDAATAERHRIITLPTIIVMRDGQERRRITGAVSESDLREALTH